MFYPIRIFSYSINFCRVIQSEAKDLGDTNENMLNVIIPEIVCLFQIKLRILHIIKKIL